MVKARAAMAGVMWLVASASCREPLADDLSHVTSPRVLAVRADPAEAAPGEPVTLTALYVDASGPLGPEAIDWAFCVDRKPLAELEPVAPSCLARTSPGIVPIGSPSTALLPEDGCRLFGPDRPAPMNGEPAGRAVDPDVTGGYYQPLRLFAPDVSTPILADVRMACGVADAPAEVAADFGKSYVPNVNPSISRLAVITGDTSIVVEPDTLDPVPIATAGARVRLVVEWPSCAPDAPGECEGAESYLHYDLAARTNELRRESMRVSWFATAGAFDFEHTGRSEAEAGAPRTEDTWRAPTEEGAVLLFIVLRDDRGGVGWRTYRVRVGRP